MPSSQVVKCSYAEHTHALIEISRFSVLHHAWKDSATTQQIKEAPVACPSHGLTDAFSNHAKMKQARIQGPCNQAMPTRTQLDVMLLQALSVYPMAAAATPSRVRTGVPSCRSGRLLRQLLRQLLPHPACLQSALPPRFQASPLTVGCNPPRLKVGINPLRVGCSPKPAWVPRPVARVPPWTLEQGLPQMLRPRGEAMRQPTCPACSRGAWD